MQITLTRNTVVAGVVYEAGDVVDASEKDARYLRAIGKAEAAEAPEEAAVDVPDEEDAPELPSEDPDDVPEPEEPPEDAALDSDELEAEKAEAAEALIEQNVPGGRRRRKK